MLRACSSVVARESALVVLLLFSIFTLFHLMGLPEGATLGPWNGHRTEVRAADPSYHQGVVGPCREVRGAFEEPGVPEVLEDLGSQENGLEELGCLLGFEAEHPFGCSIGQVWVPPFDWVWVLPVDLAWQGFEIPAGRVG